LVRLIVSIVPISVSVEILGWVVYWLRVLTRAVIILSRAVRITLLLVLLPGLGQLLGRVVHLPTFTVLT